MSGTQPLSPRDKVRACEIKSGFSSEMEGAGRESESWGWLVAGMVTLRGT